jgi:hypothetical protein
MGYEYARAHDEFTRDGGLYSHSFSLKKVTENSSYGPRGILNRLQKIPLMDEYDELNILARSKILGAGTLFLFGSMMYFLMIAGFVPLLEKNGFLWLVHVTPLCVLSLILLRLFPSILYLSRRTTLKIKEWIFSRFGVPLPKEAPVFSYTRLDPAGRDLEFIKNLSDVGSPEIEELYLSQANRITKETKGRNNISRLGSVFLAISILFVYWITNPLNISRLMATFGFFACPAALMFFGAWAELVLALEQRLRLARLRRVQTDQDRNAGDFARALQAEEFKDKELPPLFCLYLRPFVTTDKIRIGDMDLETIVAYSVARICPMLALGHPGEHIGAGRIKTSDEHWQEEIMRLIENAKLIFIIPSHREGTLWEIRNLKQGKYLSKTIFIMPPNIMFEQEPYEMQWHKAQDAAVRFDVQLPLYSREGILFRMNVDGTLARTIPLGVEEHIFNTHGPN